MTAEHLLSDQFKVQNIYVDPRITNLVDSFKHKVRDFVFLVNVSGKTERGMVQHLETVKKSLQLVLDNSDGSVENTDCISLIAFAKNARRLFSLVEKQKNFVQLRNQINCLRPEMGVEAQLGKAIQHAVTELNASRDQTIKKLSTS